MPDLDIDTGTMISAGSNLRRVANEFNTADDQAASVASHAGDEDLAAAIRGFASSWDSNRADILEGIAQLGDACTAIGETFENVDRELGAALRGEA